MKRLAYCLTLCALFLSGCESMSVSECKVADWERVGRSDGARGDSDRRIVDYTEDCGKAGVTPNAAAYRRGWDVGILQFCTASNGWREGAAGHSSKAAVCLGQPGHAVFARYLDAGLQVYHTQQAMQRNDSETARLQKLLETSKNDDEKKRAREELRRIDRDQFRLRERLAQQQTAAP